VELEEVDWKEEVSVGVPEEEVGDSQGGLPGQGGIGVEIWRRKKMFQKSRGSPQGCVPGGNLLGSGNV